MISESALITWKLGRCLAWDVTIFITVAVRYFLLTCQQVESAAIRVSEEKIKNYCGALKSMHFMLICIDALGSMNCMTKLFLMENEKIILIFIKTYKHTYYSLTKGMNLV